MHRVLLAIDTWNSAVGRAFAWLIVAPMTARPWLF